MESIPEPLRRVVPFVGVAVVTAVGFLLYGQVTGGAAHEPVAEAAAAPTALDLEAAADEKDDRREDEVAGPIVSLGDPFVINLGDPGLRTTVRVGVAVQVDEGTPVVPAGDGAPVRLAEEALARHVVISTLGSLTSANLLGLAEREEVRKTLVKRLNRSLPATLVLAAYFTELTVSDAASGAQPADLATAGKVPSGDEDEDEERAGETDGGEAHEEAGR